MENTTTALRSSYDRLLSAGLENASFMFHHGFLAKGGLPAKEALAKRRDAQPIFLAILCHVIPECIDGNQKVANQHLQELLQDLALQPDQLWCMKEALLMTFEGTLGGRGFSGRLRDMWDRAVDQFLAAYEGQGDSPTSLTPPPGARRMSNQSLDLYPYEEHQSEAADGEEPETGREMRQDINEILELERKNMIVDGGFSEIVDYLLFQDKVSFFANEMNGFLCVEPEQDLQPLLDLSIRPMNFERFVFMFCSTEPGQQHHLDFRTGPRISAEKHVMYGSTVAIKHVYTGKWLCVQKNMSATYSRNSYKVQLIPEDAMDSACTRFKILPRYKIRKHGEKVRIGDRALLVPEGTSKEQQRYIHASHHKWAGKAHLLEVNCASNPTAWTILLYDKFQPAHTENTDPLIRAGEVITLIHKEIDGFLTGDAIDIVEHFPADPTESSDELMSSMSNTNVVQHVSSDKELKMRTKTSFTTPGTPKTLQPAEVPMHTLCNQMFHVLSNGPAADAYDDSPLFFMQPQLKGTSMNPAEMEISSNSLWIVEKATAVCGGPLAPLTPYRLKHFASCKYLTLLPAAGGAFKVDLTTEVTADTFFVFHTLDQATRIVDSSTSFLRIQHQRTGAWLQCPLTVGQAAQMPSGRIARSLHVHGSRVLPLRVTTPLPDGDVFAMVTPKGSPDVALKKVLHHLRVLQEFNNAFYTHQYVYNSTQMRQIIRNAKGSLTELICFCTESNDADPLTRSGIPLRRNQKVIIDQGVAKVVLEMLKTPFFITKGSAVKQPLVAIKDINQQEHATLHSVCVLCYRLLKQMVFGSPSFALELTSAIPFMMKQLGYRFHVADTLSQMFTDNTMLIEHVSVTMVRQWIEHAKQQKNQLRYAKFLAKICVCNGVNIPRIQELVAQHVMEEAPELLVKMKLVPATETEDAYVAVQLGADASAGDKNKKAAPELKPMEPIMVPGMESNASSRVLRTMKSMGSVLSWKRRALGPSGKNKAVSELKKGAWVNLTTFCKEIGPALTGNLDATLMLYCEICLHNDVVREKVRELVSLDMLLEVLGEDSKHKELQDKYMHRFLRLCTRLHLDKRGPMQAERNKIILWSEVKPQPHSSLEVWFNTRLKDNGPTITSLKAASLHFLSGNSIQFTDQTERNTLIQAHLEMWHVFLQQSQCTLHDVKDLLGYLLPLMDYRTDRRNSKSIGGIWDRWSTDPQNQVLMGCKAQACDILHAILDSIVDSAVYGTLATLRMILEQRAQGKHSGSTTDALMEYLRAYLDAHELGAGLIEVPYLLSILLDLARSQEDSLTSKAFHLLFRLFSFRAEVNRCLQEVLILFNDECNAVCDRLCNVIIDIKWFFDHIQSNAMDDQILQLMGHLDLLINSLKQCEKEEAKELYTANQDILSNLGVFQYLVRVVRLGGQLTNYKSELLSRCYILMRLLCVNHIKNKQVLLNYIDDFVPHITFDVECDPCIREIFCNSPDLATQLQVMPASDGLVDAFTLLIAQEYTLKPQATVKNLAFLEQIVVVNGVPVPRMQTLVMTSLLKHNSDFVMLLPDPDPSMSDELLQCIAAAVHLLGQCALGKNSTTESMVQNLFPLKAVLAVVSEMEHPIHVRYRMEYVFLLTEVWFVTEESEVSEGTENEYKWMVNENWWEAVEAFLRLLSDFRDMTEDDPEFQDYRTFVFKGILPCFTSYLAFFWDSAVAAELPPQVTTITNNVGILAAEYVLDQVHRDALSNEDWTSLAQLLQTMNERNFACDGKIPDSLDQLDSNLSRSPPQSPAVGQPRVHRGMEEMYALRRPAAQEWDNSPVDNLANFIEIVAGQLKESGEEDELLQAMLQRLEGNMSLAEDSRIGLLVFLTGYVQRSDESELFDCQVRMGNIGCLTVVTHLFEGNTECSGYAVELGKAVLHGGNEVLQDQLLADFQSHNEDFFVRISETFEAAIDILQEREREKAYIRDSVVSPRTISRVTMTRKEKMLVHVTSILRMLQLLCEGHHIRMQNYVRHQHDNLYSFNMVTEVACFLRAVISVQPDNTLVDVATQALNTLTEFCQGPCADNQRTLVSANICGDASDVLQRPYPGCSSKAVQVLHSSAVLTLLSLLEGCNDKMLPTLMVDTIRLSSACSILGELWLKIRSNIENNIDLSEEDEEMLDKSFNIYILLYILMTWTKNAELDRLLKEVEGGRYFQAMLGVIEIARDDGIEKVYFRKPTASNMLTYEAKESLLSKINRDSPASKVMDFYERATEAIFELEFYQEAKKYLDQHLPLMNFGGGRYQRLNFLRRARQQVVEYMPQSGVQKLEDVTLITAFVLNFLILVAAAQDHATSWEVLQYVLVFVQFCVSTALTIL
eukprot:EG_transcript_76